MKYVKCRNALLALVFILGSLTGGFAQAQVQTLGSLHLPSPRGDLIIQKGMDLEMALEEIEKQSNVAFLYRTDAVKGKKVASTKTLSKNVGKALASLLKGQGLSFKYLNPKTYGIYVSSNSGKEKEVLPIQEPINGTVTDASSGETLPGVNILVKGTSVGASTDENGSFELEVPSLQDTLIVSFIGYQSKEVPINGRTEIDIVLETQTIAGDEIVVMGYGVNQKSSMTSSISRVDNEKLDQFPTGRVENALRGAMSGVSVASPRNTPGAAPHVRIRGVASLDAGNDPLIVIDGYPGGSLEHLNMNDVESIEVLKDASAASIYGSRGAGGVIEVTTKRGSADGRVMVSYDGYYGVSSPMLHDDWLTGEEWYEYLVKYQNREFAWAGGDTDLPMYGDPARPQEYQVNPLTYELPQTVWEDEVTRTAPIHNHNVSVSGGGENVRYYVSGNYQGEEGTVKTASYKRLGVRGNLDIEVSDKVDMGINLNPSYSKRRVAGSQMNSLVKYPPFVPPTDPDIDYYPRTQDYIPRGHSGQASPYTYLFGTENYNIDYRNEGQIFANIQPFEGMQLRSSVGSIINFGQTDYFRGSLGDPAITTYGQDIRTRYTNLINENTLSYTTNLFEGHEITVLLGASYQSGKSHNSYLRSEIDSYNNEIIKTINNATVNPTNSTSLKSSWGLVSYFTRLNYDLEGRYLVSAVFRTDGSSRFGNNRKWGNFPSLSLAWVLSEERFMSNIESLNELKVRSSYGVSGNNNIGNYSYLGTISTVSYSAGNEITEGLVPGNLENPNLGWEKTVGLGIGLDISMFDNRFNLTLDYYDNRTSDLLYNVNVPAITGFTSALSNIGEIRNYGGELELSTVNFAGDFGWNTSFNISRNYNEVIDLGDVEERVITYGSGMSWILREGEPMFSYYGYKIQGIFDTEEEIANSPSLPGAKPGNPIVADRNNDGVINDQDKELLGNFQPKYILGMTNDISWKQFDMSLQMYASLGAKMYNLETQMYQGNTLGAMRRGAIENEWWSPEEPGDGMTPAGALSQYSGFNGPSDYYIENSSYFTIRDINIGYTLPIEKVEKIGLRGLRVYSSVSNLLMIKSDENNSYNPEGYTSGEITGVVSRPGLNYGAEPINRTFTVGLNLDF